MSAMSRKRQRTDYGPYARLVGGSHVRMPPMKSGIRAFLGGNNDLNNLIKGTDQMANIPISGGLGGVQKILSEGVAFCDDNFTMTWENGIVGFLVCGVTSLGALARYKLMIHYIDFTPLRLAGFDNFYTDESPSDVALRIQRELAYAISVNFGKTYPRFQFVNGGSDTFNTQSIEVDVYPSPLIRNLGGGYPIIVSATDSGQLCFRSNFEDGYTNDPSSPTTSYYFNIFTPSEKFFDNGGRAEHGRRSGLIGKGWVGRGAHVFGFGKKVPSDGDYYDDYTGPFDTPNLIYSALRNPDIFTSAGSLYTFLRGLKLRQFVCGYMPAKVIPSRYYFIQSEELTAKQRRPGVITNASVSDNSTAIGVQMEYVGYGNSRQREPPFIAGSVDFNPMYTIDTYSFDIVDEYGDDVTTSNEGQYSTYHDRTFQYMQAYGNPVFNNRNYGGASNGIQFLLAPDATCAAQLRQVDKVSLETPFNYPLLSNNPLIVTAPDISELIAPTAVSPQPTLTNLGSFIPEAGVTTVPNWRLKPSSSRVLKFSAVGF